MAYALLMTPHRRSPLRDGYGSLGAVGLGDTVDDLAQQAGDAIYQRFMDYARPAVKDLTDQATHDALDIAKSMLNSVVDQAVEEATPAIKKVVLDTATEALQSGALQEMAATTKQQAIVALLACSALTVVATVFLLRRK